MYFLVFLLVACVSDVTVGGRPFGIDGNELLAMHV